MNAGADLVHFDGPHKTYDVIKEAIFFGERSRPGTVFVFDDYQHFYIKASVSREVGTLILPEQDTIMTHM